jgi:hypothetical protein
LTGKSHIKCGIAGGTAGTASRSKPEIKIISKLSLAMSYLIKYARFLNVAEDALMNQ